MNTAKVVIELTVVDPDTKGDVDITVCKHEGGGMFAIDSSFLDQCFDDDSDPVIPDPFSDNGVVGEVHHVRIIDDRPVGEPVIVAKSFPLP